jgi:hypothetical protein
LGFFYILFIKFSFISADILKWHLLPISKVSSAGPGARLAFRKEVNFHGRSYTDPLAKKMGSRVCTIAGKAALSVIARKIKTEYKFNGKGECKCQTAFVK